MMMVSSFLCVFYTIFLQLLDYCEIWRARSEGLTVSTAEDTEAYWADSTTVDEADGEAAGTTPTSLSGSDPSFSLSAGASSACGGGTSAIGATTIGTASSSVAIEGALPRWDSIGGVSISDTFNSKLFTKEINVKTPAPKLISGVITVPNTMAAQN
eukprot:GDKJ01042694.1.p2 GENE.GDKJ01042694.1~~GDKJ01042694.1.p2  ORF type:complete len:156 (+),score=7.37 GDKJ01042694.1:165-632(+)